MAASLIVPPPALAYSNDPLWVLLNTSSISLTFASVTLAITNSGPTAGQTLTLAWAGNSLTFTVAASPDTSGLQIPTKGAETLSAYADRIVEALRQNETLHGDFAIQKDTPSGGAERVKLTRRVLEILTITVTETLADVTATVVNVTTAPIPANLRALVEVWADAGGNADTRLLALHAPYNPLALYASELDIHAAFAGLTPTLPSEASIPPASLPPTAIYKDVAGTAFQKYYVRFADKKGSPAVAEALVKSPASYLALLGSRSPEAASADVTRLAHNYRLRSGGEMVKPVAHDQPDWVYYMPFEVEASAHISCKLYWSDGSETTHVPSFSGSTFALDADKLYWFVSGFRQLRLHLVTPPTADAYIVAYDWRLGPADEDGVWKATVRYAVDYLPHFGLFLLYENGVGGCETAWLRGKAQQGYDIEGETALRPRGRFWDVAEGELMPYDQSARATWELSSGWHDADYIEHLRQLPLATHVWLVDMTNRRFLRVVVEPKKLDAVREDDRDLHELQFTVRAAWQDTASNL